ncbi:hypothetical protein ACFX2C_004093 [Malus domestica]
MTKRTMLENPFALDLGFLDQHLSASRLNPIFFFFFFVYISSSTLFVRSASEAESTWSSSIHCREKQRRTTRLLGGSGERARRGRGSRDRVVDVEWCRIAGCCVNCFRAWAAPIAHTFPLGPAKLATSSTRFFKLCFFR